MHRRNFLGLTSMAVASAAFSGLAGAQSGANSKPFSAASDTAKQSLPIIDVHMHCYPADEILSALPDPVTGKLTGLKNGEAHMQACLAEMNRWNIVKGVVSGGSGDRIGAALHWQDAAPDRIIAAAGIRGSADTPFPDFEVVRKDFQDGRLHVLGEITAQYAGLTISDPMYEPYLTLAEQLDIPVALHTGMGPPGTSFDPCCRGFRARLGNPELIEDALNQHPKLRLNLMHAGWPYLEETLAVMTVYPQVSADLGALGWGLPRGEFNAYLGALTRAGFGKRVMFGSDHMYWPELIGMSIEAVNSATFLTPSEKRDIFYENAVRFYRLKGLG
jgi:predicted TIM-barrel fold metal-dependent hydrolase